MFNLDGYPWAKKDPSNLDKFNITKFYHIQKGLKVGEEEEEIARKDPKYHLKKINAETRDILDELDREYKAPEKKSEEKKVADRFNAIQGGDPTGTGTGGESIWKVPFKDECKPHLLHAGRGILSMANSGPDTNKSQFFITFRSAKHLDGKHTVFGRVVGGLETLDKVERIEVDMKDRPLKEVKVETTAVFVNPYEEADEELAKEREDELARLAKEAADKHKPRSRREEPDSAPVAFKSGVGKYIKPSAKRSVQEQNPPTETVKKKTKTKTATAFRDFSAW